MQEDKRIRGVSTVILNPIGKFILDLYRCQEKRGRNYVRSTVGEKYLPSIQYIIDPVDDRPETSSLRKNPLDCGNSVATCPVRPVISIHPHGSANTAGVLSHLLPLCRAESARVLGRVTFHPKPVWASYSSTANSFFFSLPSPFLSWSLFSAICFLLVVGEIPETDLLLLHLSSPPLHPPRLSPILSPPLFSLSFFLLMSL